MPRKTKKTADAAAANDRPVVYEIDQVYRYVGDDAMTVAQAMEYLGWTTDESEARAAGIDEPLLKKDYEGNKVWCLKNDHNREFQEPWARHLAQDILRKNFHLNGETVIIGRTGRVLSAQHRLVGLVLAGQEWDGKNGDKWKENWPTEPTIDTYVVVGISEDVRVTRTLDNVRPRTLRDVFFAEGEFSGLTGSARGRLCQTAEHAIKWMWYHTKMKDNYFVRHRTHSEAVSYWSAHPRLKDAVTHVFQEDKDGGVSRYVSAGYAAALMYLMGVSASDGDEYWKLIREGCPNEADLDFSHWDKARDFWSELAKPTEGKLGNHVVRFCRRPTEDKGYIFVKPEKGQVIPPGTLPEKLTVLAKAWVAYRDGMKWSPGIVTPRYKTLDGAPFLDEHPGLGGIDRADEDDDDKDQDAGDEDTGDDEGDEVDPTPEEIAARQEEERKERQAAAAAEEEERREKAAAKTRRSRRAKLGLEPAAEEEANGDEGDAAEDNGDTESAAVDEDLTSPPPPADEPGQPVAEVKRRKPVPRKA